MPDYKHHKFNGTDYIHYGRINEEEIYINAAIPMETRQRVVHFLESKGREWMMEHIGHRSDQAFRRAEGGVDPHWYTLQRPSVNDDIVVLVDRH